ncbi:hypothetical protein C5F61_09165 [Photobacterium damselae subsp. damselae]|uniref:replication initiation factor domain-containing protein n=1 Tax=Photobacterium damselae TaxID=38293 RepID=UPI000D064C55|nr:replication initiation factor domain-containing protein [Photobacterium damselae]PSB78000.1 hypothetical protein C5F61_09165 [Photobacterium damselae subsp. damselae]
MTSASELQQKIVKPTVRVSEVDWLSFSVCRKELLNLEKCNDRKTGMNLFPTKGLPVLPKKRDPMFDDETPVYVDRAKILCERFFGLTVVGGFGKMGYTDGFKLFTPDRVFAGSVFWGGNGNNNTFHFQITGQGCCYLFDVIRRTRAGQRELTPYSLLLLFQILGVEYLSRCDLKIDIRDKSLTFRKVKNAYNRREFSRGRGAYPVATHYHKFAIDGETKGETFMIGQRGNNVFWRIYDKAKQLNLDTDWLRVEVELKNCEVSVLENTTVSFASLCPFSEKLTQSPFKKKFCFNRVVRTAAENLIRSTEWLRRQCSKTLLEVINDCGSIEIALGVILAGKEEHPFHSKYDVPRGMYDEMYNVINA